MSIEASVVIDHDDVASLERAVAAAASTLKRSPGRTTVWHGEYEAFALVVRADGTGAAAFSGAAARRAKRLLLLLALRTRIAATGRRLADGQRSAYAVARLSPSLLLRRLRQTARRA